MKLQSARKLFLSDAFTASSTLPCLWYIFASMHLCIEEIFPPQWRNTSVYLWTWLVAGPQGLSSISVLTGCSVTNQLPRPHLSNQIMTHSLWTSAGHLEVPVMFYLHLTHTYTIVTFLYLFFQEIAAYLITFEKHDEWLTTSPKTRWEQLYAYIHAHKHTEILLLFIQ